MNWGSYITSAACTVRLWENNRRSNRGYRDVGSVVKNQIRPMSSKTRNTIRIKPIMPIPP
jgi:hypothetical protein